MVMAVSVISAVKETFITTNASNALSIEVVVALPYDFLRH